VSKKRLFLIGTMLLILALVVPTVLGASVHLKGGKNAKPAFYDGGLWLNASGALSGLGNGDVLITLEAAADVTSSCINPGTGEHRPPGQNPAPITVAGSEAIPAEEVKNGNTPFDVTTLAPDPLIPGAPDCPNSNWTETIDDLSFTSATIYVEQPEGNLVLTVTCSFSPATSDGAVPAGSVSCSQS
jgi:hypothetical protein